MLSEKTIAWLEERRISPETASRFGVYTANITTMRGATVVAFPFMEDGVVVNEKFRQLPKQKFWQHRGRRKIFWNADILNDPMLCEEGHPLVICEGEIDGLSVVEGGYPFVVSVPDGAPPPGSLDGRSDGVDGDAEQTGKFEFLFNARDKLRGIKRFILAVDGDPAGRALGEQLVRRLSAARCSFVEYPLGCKDFNDVLVKHGVGLMNELINTAKPYPVRGLYRLSDYPEQGELETFATGWHLMDLHLRLFAGEFMVVTGIPSHGKSSWVLNLLADMAEKWGWRSVIFSPEMSVVPMIRARLRALRSRKQAATADQDAWIEDNFCFIGPDPVTPHEDSDYDLRFIIERAEDAVLRDGVRILLIDPWNEVEHAIAKGQTTTQYVGDSIRELRKLARMRNMAVIVVAHPTKLHKTKNKKGEEGEEYAAPTLYDISDSAHWYNKADHGIVIHRNSNDVTSVTVVKSRFEEAGERGGINMRYSREQRRFVPLDGGQ